MADLEGVIFCMLVVIELYTLLCLLGTLNLTVSEVVLTQHQEVSLVHNRILGKSGCLLWSQISWCYKHTWLMEGTYPNPYDQKLHTWQLFL